MKKYPDFIKTSLLFYTSLFGLQLFFYFAFPSFYLSSTQLTDLPGFIKWGFIKYFSLVVTLYLLWGFLLGTFHWSLFRGSFFRSAASTRRLHLLHLIQFLMIFLWMSWTYPSVLNHYPPFKILPLGLSYGLLALGILWGTAGFLKRSEAPITRRWLRFGTAVLAPVGIFAVLMRPVSLNLPSAASSPEAEQNLLLLGFDALDGDSGNAAIEPYLQKRGGVLFTNAFTPLPLTHPAWNSILTGLYPKRHQVRYFFDSPFKPEHPELYLPNVLKNKAAYRTLYAADLPETSYFTEQHYFDDTMLATIGWKAHMFSMIANHFILPAVWLNNRWVEQATGVSFNYASLFNYDLSRFINASFIKLKRLGDGPKFMAFHSCFLHTPIRLNHEELRTQRNFWGLSPRDFSYWKWPRPGDPQHDTPDEWVNPYFIRRQTLQNFLNPLLAELDNKGYLDGYKVILLSDHGERFVKDKEVYGGVHGVDLETREQSNVMLGILDPRIKELQKVVRPVGLIDLAPTMASLLGMDVSKLPYDGIALLDADARPLHIPDRPLWAESMGYIDDAAEQIKFPQIDVKTLEESLIYHPSGAVTINADYYRRILKEKEHTNLAATPQMFQSTAKKTPSFSIQGPSF